MIKFVQKLSTRRLTEKIILRQDILMENYFKKFAGWFVSVLLWLWAITPKIMDWIGRTTLPDDWQSLTTEKLPGWLHWLFQTPWWVPVILASILTGWMMWITLPKSSVNAINIQPEAKTLPEQPRPENLNPLESYFTKKKMRLVDLVDSLSFSIENKVFEDCELFGPAIVYLTPDVPMRFDNCTFNGKPDSMFLELSDQQQSAQGVIGLRGCTFLRCTFHGIGIIASKEMKEHFMKNISPSR